MPKLRVTHRQQQELRREQEDIAAYRRRLAREQREYHHYTYSGGITRCSKCPPQRSRAEPHRFCPDCARINRARQHAGLIRPKGSPEPSADNIINPIVVGKYKGPTFQRRYNNSPQPVVTAFVEHFRGGWRRGVALLNGKRIYVGDKTQSQDDAWDYASNSARLIKIGLQFESQLADHGY